VSQVPDVAGQGSVPALPADFQFANTGLEDFSVTDAVLPRIKIEHTEGLWSENLGNTRMEVLRFIPLGLVKQRTLFHHKVEDNDVPMCKSSDFQTGYPNPEAPQNKSFPWDLAGFDPNNFPPNAEGLRPLPCDGCQLKEWGSSPVGDNPYCSEQWTIPVYFDPTGNSDWSPAILTLQKSSIKPIRSFLTAFAQSNRPPFLVIARGTLKVNERGSVKYSIPTFVQEGESPRERWNEFSEQFGEMRSFLTRPPIREVDGDTPQAPAQGNVNQPPQQYQQQAPVQGQVIQQPPQQQAPPAAQPPQQGGDPWATPTPAPQAGDPWAGQQQQPPAQPAQPPVQQAPAEPVQPQPTEPPQGATPPAPPAGNGGLPF
jgi:hypothetical protein